MSYQDYKEESAFLSFLNPRLRKWEDGFVEVELDARPEFLNRSGVLHGGVLSSVLDHVGGMCGMYCTVEGNRRYGMTLNLNVNFIGQAKAGLLVATGTRVKAGSKIFFSEMRIETVDGDVLATGSGVFRFRTGSEKPEGVPPTKV